ncbi:phage tail tape measure protein [Natronincola ferrireducens]|uniref:Phage tail tape measure protein, TP901 family, core region n=1 Tax=Natronincola ferrireducens TaxID=393762 RepID=A0A1G9I6R0_9FIRM|nr:phage tail tape measure protein [Natronincola ferrireducens]SDL20735.1 phage tail tape measure protein, TP901 family, core region [Natronincola ferrireducens]
MSSFKNYRRSIILDFNYDEVKKGVPDVNKQMALLNAEFRKQSEQASQTGNSMDKLGVKQEAYANKVKIQADKVAILKKELEKLENTEVRNEKAIANKTIALKNAETQLMKYEKSLEDINAELGQQDNFFTKAADNIEGFSDKLKANNINIEEFGKGLYTLGAGMTAAITVPLVALGTISTKTFMDFENAFTGVRKTVEATEEQFKALEKGIRDMSKEIPSSAVEIAGVAEAAGQLGIETESILGFTRTMIDLGQATNMSANEAATSLARLANITQMPQDQFDRLGSTVVALGNNLATTESEIVNMGLRLAGAGKQVGMSEAQILSFAGALSSVGIEAEAGGSAFSKVMVEMQLAVEKGGDKLRDFARVSGMSAGEFKRVFKEDATTAIIAFIEGLGNMQGQGRSAIKVLDDMGISEVRMRDALLRASGAGDLFTKSIETGTKAWEENTALTEEAQQRYETLTSKIEIFLNKLKDVALTIGGSIAPVLSDMIDILTPMVNIVGFLFDLFSKLPEPIRKVVVVALMLVAAIGPILAIVGKLMQNVGNITGSLNTVGKAVSTLTGFFTGFNPVVYKTLGIILLVVAALTALGIVISTIMGRSNDLQASMKSVGDSVGNIKMPQVPNMPSYATGTRNHPGGLALVGEKGPEIVNLPKGAQVFTNEESKQMLSDDNNNFNQSQYDERYERLLVRFDRMIAATEKMQKAYEDNRRFSRMGEVPV